jgi:hypothetical protein
VEPLGILLVQPGEEREGPACHLLPAWCLSWAVEGGSLTTRARPASDPPKGACSLSWHSLRPVGDFLGQLGGALSPGAGLCFGPELPCRSCLVCSIALGRQDGDCSYHSHLYFVLCVHVSISVF